MDKTIRARIGLVSSGTSSSHHHDSFKAFIPEEIQVDFKSLELHGDSLYEQEGKKKIIITKITDLVNKNRWDALIASGAPKELLNPGLLSDLKATLKIPVTTALNACVCALRSFQAKKILLMTPFDKIINEMICAYLAKAGITASAPREFRHTTEASRLSPDEVYNLTKTLFGQGDNIEAIYFQGAVLDPLKVLERIEKELDTTVVASNPAMLWFILSKLGLRYEIEGYGKLLARWCSLPE